MFNSSNTKLTGLALILGLTCAGSASATIGITDNNKDGSFINSDITYGDGSAQAFVTPLLFATDFGNTQAASVQVAGAGIDYSYGFSGSGSSVAKLQYTFTSTRLPSDIFPNVNGLRFMLDIIAYGSAEFTTTDKASPTVWPAAAAGDPDKRQVQDLNLGALNSILISNNGVTDGAFSSSCLTGCTTDFGLEWDLPVLGPGQKWTINVSLVDNPALVVGGRYLKAESLDVPGNVLVVGNPTLVPEPASYAMLLAGIAMLAVIGSSRMRRVAAP